MSFKLLVEPSDGKKIVFSPASGCTLEQAFALFPPDASCRIVEDSEIQNLIGGEVGMSQAKALRTSEVDAIVVTTASGKTFDGDEKSQDRMARAITAMDDTETILWVLADNTPATVTRAELREALRLASEAQTAIWVRPYQ